MSLRQLKKKPLDQERFLLIVTAGCDQTGKAGLAFAHAAHLAAHNHSVRVFLVLEGAKWAFENFGTQYKHECFDRPHTNLKNAIELGASVILCNACFEAYSKEGFGELAAGIKLGGLSSLDESLSGETVITY